MTQQLRRKSHLKSATPSTAKGSQFAGISTTKYGTPSSMTPVTEGLSVSVVDADSLENTVNGTPLDGASDDVSLVATEVLVMIGVVVELVDVIVGVGAAVELAE
ncbi:unnamed protein product [[Candida] boidinii]|nr:unnamed protein product [[Candida] boidinii]